MAERKVIPGPGNPAFIFAAPSYTSSMAQNKNVICLAFCNTVSPNQWRPPGYPRLKPGDFGGDAAYNGTNDSNSWNAWRKALGSFAHPGWEAMVRCHLRAAARQVADVFEYFGYVRGSGARGDGQYESGIYFLSLSTFFNSQPGDSEFQDLGALYAHANDAAPSARTGSWAGAGQGVYPDNVMDMGSYLPASGVPHLAGKKATLYTPWCTAGIAEGSPRFSYFCEVLKAELDAKNLCYPFELVLDDEQSPIHWSLALPSGGEQIGSINNIRADPRYLTDTIYEVEVDGVWVPRTYADHFNNQIATNPDMATAVSQGRFSPYLDQYYRPVAANDIARAGQACFKMLYPLYLMSYDFARHKMYGVPWKTFFPEGKWGNYDDRFVPTLGGKPWYWASDTPGYIDTMRADFSTPVLYPNLLRIGYEGHADAFDGIIAYTKDLVDQCGGASFGREKRAWVRFPTTPTDTVTGLLWNQDRFAKQVQELAEVGAYGFYMYNEMNWTGGTDAVVTDGLARAKDRVNRYVRGVELDRLSFGRRR